jgi:ADP-glucose pyrophosphorylase
MPKKVFGIVLAGGEGKRLMPLTEDRAKPAVPFGGQYRLVDFAISNLINILDLECVFLCGGISKNGHILKRKTEKHLKTYVLPNLQDKAQVKISILNEKNSGIMGAVASIRAKLSTVYI